MPGPAGSIAIELVRRIRGPASRLPDAARRGELHSEASEGPAATTALAAAVEALILAAEGRGPLLHGRVGMRRAMNHGRERVFSDRKETHWGKRKQKRDW
jgi:hypothetical protein